MRNFRKRLNSRALAGFLPLQQNIHGFEMNSSLNAKILIGN